MLANRWRFRLSFRIVSRQHYDGLVAERRELMDALRNANNELRRHRTLIAGLRDGDEKMTEAVARALQR